MDEQKKDTTAKPVKHHADLNDDPQKKHPVGRPSQYKDHYPELAYKYCRNHGFTNVELAELFKICTATLWSWQQKHPEFLSAIKKGKEKYDSEVVERGLRRRAVGYQYYEDTYQTSRTTDPETGQGKLILKKRILKSMAPDPTSMIFWLKNRQPQEWRG